MKLFGDETKRRIFDISSDTQPSMSHNRNYSFIRKYIKNKKVLDVGCWSGQFEQLILNDTKDITAIDPGEKAIEYAKKRLPKVKFMVGTLNDISLPKNSFDAVLLLDVLEHLPQHTEIKTFQKVHALLKKNGYFIMSTPNSHLLSILLDPAFYLIGHRHYSQEALKALLVKANFSIVETFTYGKLATLFYGIWDLVEKYLIHKKTSIGQFIQARVREENVSGFASVFVVAKKCSIL